MEMSFSSTVSRVVRSEIRELLAWTRMPGVISFGGGLPDPSLFPVDELREITDRVLLAKGYRALQYGPTPGEPEMVEALVGHMRSFGEEAGADNVCVTASSQQGLDLVTHLLVDPGSPVVVELPSYIGALQAFARAGADLRGVRMEEDGMDLADLERVLDGLEREGKRPRFVYVIPDFQNPSGINTSLAKRRALVEIAARRGIPLVEDSPYRELNYSGDALPSLWTISGGEGVVLLKTFSKMLLPGMRLGWLVAEPAIQDRVVAIKQSVDLCASAFTQSVLAEYVAAGKMRETIARAVECYRPKRDAMLRALAAGMPEGAWWSRPDGGMFLWLRLPPGSTAAELFERSAPRGVVFVKGRQFHCDGSGEDCLRLNYSFPSVEQIERGVAVLSEAAAELASGDPVSGSPRAAGARGAA